MVALLATALLPALGTVHATIGTAMGSIAALVLSLLDCAQTDGINVAARTILLHTFEPQMAVIGRA